MRGWLVYQPGYVMKQQGDTPFSYPTRRLARDAAKSLSILRCIPHRVIQVWISPYKYKAYQWWLVYNNNRPISQQNLTNQNVPRVYPTKQLALQMAEHYDKVYAGKHEVVKVRVYQ